MKCKYLDYNLIGNIESLSFCNRLLLQLEALQKCLLEVIK